MDFETLQHKVGFWATKRGILEPENYLKQFLKFISETGELADAIIKHDHHKVTDGFGDVLVTLIILSKQMDFDLVECLNDAYREIENREGQTINGIFVKNE